MPGHSRLVLVAWSLVAALLTTKLSALLVGCGEDSHARTGADDAGPYAPSVTITVSTANGGRVVSSDGRAVLSIPPGALAQDTAITVRVLSRTSESLSDVYDFGPDGLAFTVPARLDLTLDASAAAAQPKIGMTHGQGFTTLPSTLAGNVLSAPVEHFTGFAAVIDPLAPNSSPPLAITVMAAGAAHTCYVVPPAGTVKCWGTNDHGQVGAGGFDRAAAPVDVANLTDVRQLAAGARHTCALLGSGGVKCWGANDRGQLGVPHDVDGGPPALDTARDVPGLESGVVALAAARNTSCALLASGTLVCWGVMPPYEWLAERAADAGPPDGGSALLREQRPLSTMPLGFTMSGANLCVLEPAGTVACNPLAPGLASLVDVGALDAGALPASGPILQTVPSVTDAQEIVTGSFYQYSAAPDPTPSASGTCARHSDGTVSCWTQGNIYYAEHETPTKVRIAGGGILGGATRLAGGDGHACAIFGPQSEVACWGRSIYGANGSLTSTPRAFVVAGLSGVTAIAAGEEHTCAARGMDVFCWGHNRYGQIGGQDVASSTPLDVVDLTDAVDIQTSMYMTCARTAAGAAKCWPYGAAPSKKAADVPGLASGVTSIGVGMFTYCAARSGAALCFGISPTGVIPGFQATPLAIPELAAGVTHVTGASTGACARTTDGRVSCWGKVDDSGAAQRPTAVGNLADAVDVSGSESARCSLTSAGGVKCWGTASLVGNGPVAPGPPYYLSSAVDVGGLTAGVASVNAEPMQTCVIMAGSGALKCWGQTALLPERALYPTDVPGLGAGVVSVSGRCAVVASGKVYCATARGQIAEVPGITDAARVASGATTCVVLKTGRAKCWGRNSLGELGSGRVPSSTIPIQIPAP